MLNCHGLFMAVVLGLCNTGAALEPLDSLRGPDRFAPPRMLALETLEGAAAQRVCCGEAMCDPRPGEAAAGFAETLLLQVDHLLTRAERGLAGGNATRAAPARVPRAPGARPQAAVALPALRVQGQRILAGAAAAGSALSEESMSSAVMMKAWILWPILLICVAAACVGWLMMAVAAQTGRCDAPGFSAESPSAMITGAKNQDAG
eukprot:CAMPEP_0168405160 /NCGR_PEP_ID=MMETSP0228-20121227/25000_1 /TAXON_ID=133427 /ORGANISM="Protoceratium reticulatum, Strain CCCM 535 (=CCMP 1889)" /LENGTH=204 /DNA_ID=CAMNT_0008418783 /DNA_START=102 /DNA_END=716 /DNA_ORIENTATION=+